MAGRDELDITPVLKSLGPSAAGGRKKKELLEPPVELLPNEQIVSLGTINFSLYN